VISILLPPGSNGGTFQPPPSTLAFSSSISRYGICPVRFEYCPSHQLRLSDVSGH
jgi:hypothetical protein